MEEKVDHWGGGDWAKWGDGDLEDEDDDECEYEALRAICWCRGE